MECIRRLGDCFQAAVTYRTSYSRASKLEEAGLGPLRRIERLTDELEKSDAI
jgi:hypothetical protein